jgi:sugar/nucleoside kinase (ribokinase family)
VTAPGLLVVGDLVTDVVALHREPLAQDTDTTARISVRPGGSAANTAAWAGWAGADVRLLARVGADAASWHREELVRGGVRPQLRIDAGRPTGVVIALVDRAGERTFVTDRGASGELGPADWADSLLDGVAHLHLSGYLLFAGPGRELAALAVARARLRGVTVSVDPASAGYLRQLGGGRFLGLLDAAGGVDLLLPNLAEARELTGLADPERAALRLSAECSCLVALKLGAAGALLARDGALLGRAEPPEAGAVDTTGAGDAFAGGLLAASLAGAEPLAAAQAGCRAGAAAVALVGGRPGVRRAGG